jgi:hypothetical protein
LNIFFKKITFQRQDRRDLSKIYERALRIGEKLNGDESPADEIKSLMHKIVKKPVVVIFLCWSRDRLVFYIDNIK